MASGRARGSIPRQVAKTVKPMNTIEMIHDGQHHQIVNLLKRVNGFHDKDRWVLERTKHRTNEASRMHSEEAALFIAWLQERDASMNQMRRKIISYAHQLGWKDARDPKGLKADYGRIDRWMTTYSAAKKQLGRQNAGELKASLDQFESMWRKEMKK